MVWIKDKGFAICTALQFLSGTEVEGKIMGEVVLVDVVVKRELAHRLELVVDANLLEKIGYCRWVVTRFLDKR